MGTRGPKPQGRPNRTQRIYKRNDDVTLAEVVVAWMAHLDGEPVSRISQIIERPVPVVRRILYGED